MDLRQRDRVLEIGFIGGGLSSAVGQTHFAASQLDGHWRLAAGVFSLDEQVNRETARAWHVPEERLYASYQELIEKEKGRLDAVAVLTPTPDHIEVLRDLLQAGIPIICEKAMVSRLADAQELQRMYDPAQHFLVVTYNYSGYPMVRELRQRIEAGELGRIQQLQLEMPQEGFVRPPDIAGRAAPPQAWRLHDDIIPTICLDLGVHLHHLSNFVTHVEPSEVQAEFNHYSSFPSIVDDVRMWLRYDNGMSTSYWMSKTAIGRRNGLRMRVFGDRGSAEWFQLSPEELQIALIDGTQVIIDRGGQAQVARQARYNRMKVGHPSGFIEAFANLYQDFAEVLREWRETGTYSNPYVYGLDHATRGLAMFHAARSSNDTTDWTRIEA